MKRCLERGDLAGLRALAAPYAPGVRLIEEASRKPRLWVWHDYDLGDTLEFPELDTVSAFSRLLKILAVAEARAGRWDRCEEKIRTILRLANLIGQEPLSIPMIVKARCDQVGMGAFGRSLAFAHDAQVVARLTNAVERTWQAPDLARALRGNPYLLIATWRNPWLSERSESADLGEHSIVRSGMAVKGEERELIARVLDEWVETASLVAHAGRGAAAAVSALRAQRSKAQADRSAIGHACLDELDTLVEIAQMAADDERMYGELVAAAKSLQARRQEQGRSK